MHPLQQAPVAQDRSADRRQDTVPFSNGAHGAIVGNVQLSGLSVTERDPIADGVAIR
jgi:hypothetical protein